MNQPQRRDELPEERQVDLPITWREVLGWGEVLGWTILAMWPFLLMIHGSAVSTDQAITRSIVLVGAVTMVVSVRLWNLVAQRAGNSRPRQSKE